MQPIRKNKGIKNRGRAIAMLVIIAGTAFIHIQEPPPFGWLKGDWTMQRRNGTLVESWELINDSTMKGSSSVISASGEKRVLENLQLVRRNNEWNYISAVSNQNNSQPVAFKITNFNGEGFVAENPLHDFPKRIRYNRIGADSIHAVIDGGAETPQKKSDYFYSRKK